MADAYDLLGVAFGASDQEIRTAYRQTALRLHPDKQKDDPRANERFAELVAAFELLKDPERRAELDAKIKARIERADRIRQQSAAKQAQIAELERREREYAESLTRRDRTDITKQKIQSELERFRAEIAKEEANRQRATATPTPPPPVTNTISVKISRKRKPAPDDDELERVFSRYGKVTGVVQSKKRRALVSFAEQAAVNLALSSGEREFLDGIGITVSDLDRGETANPRSDGFDAADDEEIVGGRGPSVSPIRDGDILEPPDDMPLDDLQDLVFRRLRAMANKQERKRQRMGFVQ
ncbi:unnamed protein product (mitochondrion) [Plasmodiophora brassicae]|uniref:J domain-containing protein n=1 Tax=Plasmodiophora brassicae TaxID=37360 RepID=A0A0G4IUV1_PLABS|nr:hypothetical protein PBRA_007028 [Plasmodiophora brassicae]SPQ92987.1 unnamed protein product [Plasmodiophora brassicae]